MSNFSLKIVNYRIKEAHLHKVLLTETVGQRIINLLSNRTIRFIESDIKVASANSIKTNFSIGPIVKLFELVAIVPLTGDLKGNFVMSFEEKFARHIVAAYITNPIPANQFEEYLNDGIGEITNLIIANSLVNLPAELSNTDIQTPHVLHNRGAELKQQNTKILSCHFETPAGNCNLSMQL